MRYLWGFILSINFAVARSVKAFLGMLKGCFLYAWQRIFRNEIQNTPSQQGMEVNLPKALEATGFSGIGIYPQNTLPIQGFHSSFDKSGLMQNKPIAIQHQDCDVFEMNFCTIASSTYLLKVCVQYYSLLRQTKAFKLYICCMDDSIFSILESLKLENAVLIKLINIEDYRLKDIKYTRTLSEYCWTLKPCLIEYIFRIYNANKIFYCDSDLYFFSDPRSVFDNLGENSVYLCPQRDLPWVEQLYGRFQAGFIGFSNNIEGRLALKWWKEECMEWCFYKNEDNRWGDQKYLDLIPEYFRNIYISDNLGVDAAPWNIIYNNNYKLEIKEDNIFIEDYKLINFHFACLDIFDQNNYDLWSLGTINISNFIKLNIYTPYILALREMVKEIFPIVKNAGNRFFCNKPMESAKTHYLFNYQRMKMEEWEVYYSFCTITSEKYVLKAISLYNSIADKLDNFYLYVCCMDYNTERIFKKLNLPNVIVFSYKAFETQELKEAAYSRDLQEYCWTLKPFLCRHILKKWGIKEILYCDSDMFFFSHPKPIWDEWKNYSIFICKQRSTTMIEEVHGIFQAGLIGFNTDEISMKALSWWCDRCLEWCSKNSDLGQNRWGDQKYLEQFPYSFYSIRISENQGVDVAPWNLLMHTYNDFEINTSKDEVFIEGKKLVAYHFGSMNIFNKKEFDLWKLEQLNFRSNIIKNIYKPYIYFIRDAIKQVKKEEISLQGLYEPFEGKKKCSNYYWSM